MAIEILLGPPASGKTETCLSRIAAVGQAGSLLPVQVIVPDRLQAAGFRRRLTARSIATRVEVSVFHRYANQVLEQGGGEKKLIGSQLALRLIQNALRDVAEREPFIHYAQVWQTAGFARLMLDVCAQFEKNGLSPNSVTATVETTTQTEIARIYRVFQEMLNASAWVSPAGLLSAAAETIRRNTAPAAAPGRQNRISLLILDGFDSFEKDQLDLIRALALIAETVLITLPTGADGYGSRYFERSLRELTEIAGDNVHIARLEKAVFLPPDLAHLTDVLTAGSTKNPASVSQAGLSLLEAGSREDEVREVLRRIKLWVLRKGVAPASCAVFAPQLEEYVPLFRRFGKEMAVPLRFGRRDMLSRLPAVQALTRLLRLSPQNFPARELIICLRSPFFDFGLDPDQVRLLDRIRKQMRITGGPEQWAESWRLLLSAAGATVLDEDGNPVGDADALSDPAALTVLRDGLEHVFALIRPPAVQRTESDWLDWLEPLLGGTGFRDRLESEGDELYAALETCFRQLRTHDKLVPRGKLVYTAFLSNLNEIFSATEAPDLPPDGQNSVFVGDLSWARGIRFAAVALCGFSEGLFPGSVREAPLPDSAFRERLGLPALESDRQNGLFVQAVARADRYLLISRPALTDEGESWEESQYWSEIRRQVPRIAVEHIRSASPRPLSEAASPGERRFWQALWTEQPAFVTTIAAADEFHPPAVLFPGQDPQEKIFSATQLETGLYCPLRYFLSDVLKLQPDPEPQFGLDALQRGNLLHRILQLTFSDGVDAADGEALAARMNEICDRVFADAPRVYRFRPSVLWPFEQQQLRRQLRKTLLGLAEESAGWQVQALEQRFGTGDVPPLTVETEQGRMQFRGVIDRIDRNAAGRFRLIDYKSGGGNLANDDFWKGRRVQIFLYALAAADVLAMEPVEEGFYWAVLSGKKSGLRLGSFMAAPEWDRMPTFRQPIQEHVARFQRMLQATDFPADPIDGTCPSYCGAAGWCARFKREY